MTGGRPIAGAPGFDEYADGHVWLAVDRELATAARNKGLFDIETLRGLIFGDESPAASHGRAATQLITLPAPALRLHWRRVLHGGALAPLWRGRIGGVRRLRNEIIATARLRARGAPVPRAALAVALRSGPLWRAGVATVHEEDALDGVAFLEQADARQRVETAARAVGRAIRLFHDLGGRHRDLHVKNVLIRHVDEADGGAGPEALVIDLDGARAGAPPSRSRRSRELRRLERSLCKRGLAGRLGDGGRRAFLAGYCDAG